MTSVLVMRSVFLRTWRKILRRKVTLTFSLLQPLMWMLFFGFLMQRYPIGEVPGGGSYLTFLVPGICAMTVLFGASQAGVNIIRDIQTGFMQRILSTPAPFWALHLGKISADGSRFLVQAFFVFLLGILLGAELHLPLLPTLYAILSLAVFGIAFGSLSCLIALKAKKPETMATFVHVVNMPIFFTSTALVPDKHMPTWLANIAQWNPLTLTVETLREALLYQSYSSFTFNLLPLVFLAIIFSTWSIFELRNGAMISPWETR